jgi:DNA-binding winged helix-turn-helix (wHTH) protein
MMNWAQGVYYQFDDYALDTNTRTLRCGDELVDLTPKVFTTLLVLVENRDKVLTKDELLTIIWPSQFVDQSNLAKTSQFYEKALEKLNPGRSTSQRSQGEVIVLSAS